MPEACPAGKKKALPKGFFVDALERRRAEALFGGRAGRPAPFRSPSTHTRFCASTHRLAADDLTIDDSICVHQRSSAVPFFSAGLGGLCG
jgi:hypothetical protein